ncbi:ADP-ribosylation factor-like protein 2-binding protein isoform X2 [Xyrauchen texanus]|uniref:ADP-ribosylation factor-like protein 2-binding protein isoform X2 n=1 Tax=Xyrauchen texanus TaxID=154827 RepID=UPI002241D5B1|nr:ADP-ribosylation factor-like protein 2-binding protein isoform X2 [Xyrauchen texanus]
MLFLPDTFKISTRSTVAVAAATSGRFMMDARETNLLGGNENIVETQNLEEEEFAVSKSSDADAEFDMRMNSNIFSSLSWRNIILSLTIQRRTSSAILLYLMNMQHNDDVSGDILDILLTFTDFMAFKEMFIDYRAEKEGRGLDLSTGLVVKSLNHASCSPLHCSMASQSS